MISIIIPTYQEASNLPSLISDIKKSLTNIEHELLIVDDNSPDGTGKIAEELSLQYTSLRVLHRKQKSGVASAIAFGISNSTGQIIGTINADKQHPPSLLPTMIMQLTSSDVVVASRYIKQGQTNVNSWRKLVSRGAIILAQLLLPKLRYVNDPMSGFFLFKRSVIENMRLLPQKTTVHVSTGDKLLLNLLLKGNYNSVVEVPYTFTRRRSGESKFGFRDYIVYPLSLFKLMVESGELKRFIKFCTVGGSGIGVNIALLYLLTDKAGIYYVVSAVFSWVGAVTSNFILNDLWTFRDFKKPGVANMLERAVRFVGTRLVGLIIYITVIFTLTDLAGFYYLISGLVAVILVVVWNYLASLNLVWNR